MKSRRFFFVRAVRWRFARHVAVILIYVAAYRLLYYWIIRLYVTLFVALVSGALSY
jgi:hypothetical protein